MSRQRQASKSPRRNATNEALRPRTAHRPAVAAAAEPNYVVSVSGRPAAAAAQSSAASPASHTRSTLASGLPPTHRAGRSNGSNIDSPSSSSSASAHARSDSHSSNGSSSSRAKSPHSSRRPPPQPHASSPVNLSGSNLTVFVPRATAESSTLVSPSSNAGSASRLPIAASSTLLQHNQARPASHSASSAAANGRAARSPKLAEVVLLSGSRGSSGHNSPAQSLTPRQLSPRLAPAAGSESSLDSSAKPVVSVSLSSATPEEESRSAAARKKQSQHRPSLSLDEDDDPSQPIADRRARAVQWMLQTIDQREEPLYCPSWFTAVDAPAMLHLADVRQHYLSLVHSFSLRDQALSYIDDVHDAWLAEKTKLKARSKINMMRALQGKALLISTQGTLQRMPGFMPTTSAPASTAASASPSSPASPHAALINGAPGSPAAGGSITPRASARSVTSTAAALLLHSSAASPPSSSAAALSPTAGARATPALVAASPVAAPAPSAAVAPLPSARSRLANLSALLTPASSSAQQQQQQPQPSPAQPQLLSPSSSTAGLNGTIAGLSPIAHAAPPTDADESALAVDDPSQSRSSAAPPPPPAAVALDALLQGVDPASLSASDLETFAALEVLLDSFPLLIKHSPAPVTADGSKSKSKAPKLSELKLIGSRLFYGWKAHRKRNKKFVRLRDIVQVRAGLSDRIAQRHEPVAAGSPNAMAAPTLLDEYCFRIESLDSSTDPPTPCELNLQADSTVHRAQWIDGIKLLARFERSRIEVAEAAEVE